MTNEQERDIIARLKDNWTGLGGLSKDEVAVLKKYKEHVGYLYYDGKLSHVGQSNFNCVNAIFRIERDFQPEEKAKSNWFVAEVDQEGFFIHPTQPWARSNISWPDNKFGGVQFHGQKNKNWHMEKEKLIDSEGDLHTRASDTNSDCRPARIARVRIWAGGE